MEKIIKSIVILSTLFVGVYNLSSANNNYNLGASVADEPQKIIDTIKVPDMQCGECESRIEGKIKKLSGVESVSSNAKEKIVIVEHTEAIKLIEIKRAIAALGYNAAEVKTTPSRRAKLPKCCQPNGHN